jgi:hypothetical protein
MQFRSTFRRACFVGAMVGVGLVGFAPAAGASPTRTPTPNPDFTAFGACAFPVAFHAVVNNEYSTTTTLADGTTIVKTTGSLVATLTNTLNGNSVTLNIGGPGTTTTYPDGSATVQLEGHSLFFFFAQAQAAFGLPGVQYGTGNISAAFDSGGNLTSYSHSGNSTDECAALT